MDALINDLADLYLEAEESQKKEIFTFFSDKKIIQDLWLYVRRVASFIKSKEDGKWLQRGLAISLIDGGRGDQQELSISLPLLRYGAERVGIDPKPYFGDAMGVSADPVKSFLLRTIENMNEYTFVIQAFGPSEWAEESIKKHGENSIAADLKKNQRNRLDSGLYMHQALGKMSKTSQRIIVGLVIIAIIVIIVSNFVRPP